MLNLLTTQEAKDLCNADYSLNSLKSGAKEPAVRTWKEFRYLKPSTEEQSELVAARTTNYGVLVGEAHRLIVLDLDAEDALVSLGTDAQLPETVTVQTSRGKHLYFEHPNVSLNSKSHSLPKVDLKSSGFVTIACSTHPNWTKYEYIIGPQEAQIAPCPAWIIDLYSGKDDGIRHLDSFQVLIDRVSAAKGGARNTTIFNAARSLHDQVESGGLDRTKFVRSLTEASSLTAEDAERAVANGLASWPAQIDS